MEKKGEYSFVLNNEDLILYGTLQILTKAALFTYHLYRNPSVFVMLRRAKKRFYNFVVKMGLTQNWK